MATRFNLPLTGVTFEKVTSVEPTAIYVARFGSVYELSLGFSCGDGERRVTGLVPLTGDSSLKTHFFVAERGFMSEVEQVPVYKAEEGKEVLRLVLEQTDEGGGNLSPRVGMIGSIGNVPGLAICIKDGDSTSRLNPIVLELGSMRARPTEYGFNETFKLVKVHHPLLADT